MPLVWFSWVWMTVCEKLLVGWVINVQTIAMGTHVPWTGILKMICRLLDTVIINNVQTSDREIQSNIVVTFVSILFHLYGKLMSFDLHAAKTFSSLSLASDCKTHVNRTIFLCKSQAIMWLRFEPIPFGWLNSHHHILHQKGAGSFFLFALEPDLRGAYTHRIWFRQTHCICDLLLGCC